MGFVECEHLDFSDLVRPGSPKTIKMTERRRNELTTGPVNWLFSTLARSSQQVFNLNNKAAFDRITVNARASASEREASKFAVVVVRRIINVFGA